MRLGLDSCRRVLSYLGEPHLQTPAVLVAGTNGKGSTAALIAAMASAAGYKTGFYSSPHLESVEERIRIDGGSIASVDLVALLQEVLEASDAAVGEPPTYFEALTLAAFLHFARQGVELAVLEVGLGGRLDATNACQPVLSVITELALDHQEHLGTTLDAIAREKAGILRAGRPAVCWVSDALGRRTLEEAAAALGAPLESAPERIRIAGREILGWEGQRITLADAGKETTYALSLGGAHQARNLALAVRAGRTLHGLGWRRLDQAALEEGAAACRWPGRLEAIPIRPGFQVVLDAAHNPHGAGRLRDYFRELDCQPDLLCGVLADKDAAGILGELQGLSGRWTLTRPASPRARPPEELRAWAPAEARVCDDLAAALDLALDTPAPVLAVAGSIYLVGPVRQRLRERFGVPQKAADLSTG
jgi:dihydrofolate synthase/folylpolyglutamate synthase